MNNKAVTWGAVIVLVLIVGWAIFAKDGSEVPAPSTEDKTQEVTKPTNTGTTLSKPNAGGTAPAPSQTKTPSQTVTLSDIGFDPSIVAIQVGDSVKFVNNSSQTMWVASDPHPSHSIYPAFNQRTAVGKGGTYTFTFTKIGSWHYHNHINPTRSGQVLVKAPPIQ